MSHAYRKEPALEAKTLITTCYHPALTRLHATLQAHHHAAIIATLSLLSTEDANMIASYFNFMVQGMEALG
ncbi:MAG: hypothetical protein OXF67_10710 [Cyanobacteria bacterium MAG CAR4_bin_6]|nr:hypothetical protein [Cyanobacteria bacterium MAG CAR4_bin_6]